jgi:hypothetical protein
VLDQILGPGELVVANESWCCAVCLWASSFSWVLDPGSKEMVPQSIHQHSGKLTDPA